MLQFCTLLIEIFLTVEKPVSRSDVSCKIVKLALISMLILLTPHAPGYAQQPVATPSDEIAFTFRLRLDELIKLGERIYGWRSIATA
jgi:hypothetical protein